MSYCSRCKNYYYGNACKCQPFRCGNEEFSGEDRTTWQEYHARDHEAAAKAWAKRYDRDDHTLLEGETVECEVIAVDGTVKKFDVYGYVEYIYFADEMKCTYIELYKIGE